MIEPRSELPLHHYLTAGSVVSEGTIGVSLLEQARKGHLVLRGKPSNPDFSSACEAVLGLSLPTKVRDTARSDIAQCYCLGPEEWLLLLDAGEEWGIELRLRDAFSGHFSIVDVSGGQTVLSLSGSDVGCVLKKSCSYDLSPQNFAVGNCVQTTFAKATALVIKRSETHFDLVIRRSFSDYIYAWIADASAEYGFHASSET
ncbi:MAG: sarcosine oxidase subunit gamma family protein [Pseudomonadota bacterium]